MEGQPLPPASPAPPEIRCDICDGPAIERHCKITCTRCGYTRDCGDP